MPPRFQIGQEVLVPASRMAQEGEMPYALMPRRVEGQNERSVIVSDGKGGTVEVASRLVHGEGLGFLVLKVGDLSTEPTLLDPLSKSVLQFLRLLVPDDVVRAVSLRTLAELDAHWSSAHMGTSHVILIGHGSQDSILFVGDGSVSGRALAERLHDLAPASRPKTFVSLACLTGRAAFSKPFSQSPVCRDLIAPFQSVHGAAASQFCQTLLMHHLLEGMEVPYAFARAAKGLSGGRRFRRWRAGGHVVAS